MNKDADDSKNELKELKENLKNKNELLEELNCEIEKFKNQIKNNSDDQNKKNKNGSNTVAKSKQNNSQKLKY